MNLPVYTDENGVLRNKLGITDKYLLHQIEYDLTTQRHREILSGNVLTHLQGYNLERQQAIHYHLFQDIYDWAGEIRTVPLNKPMANGLMSVFAPPDLIRPRWQRLEQVTAQFVQQQNVCFDEKIRQLATIFAEANYLHPFPEGNGRSLQTLMQQLALEQNIKLDFSKNDPKAWNYASAVCGVYGELIEENGKKQLIAYPADKQPIYDIFQQMASEIK